MSSATAATTAQFQYTNADFQEISRVLYEEAGIHLPPTKSMLVYSRIAKRLRALGLERFRDYCALVGSEQGSEEKAQMLSALTTNVTRFFREPHHFSHLKTKLLPTALDGVKRGRRLRIWSAGCSSGQEPYSIALTILQMQPDARAYDIKILATDINPEVIATGKKGIYPAAEYGDVQPDMRQRWLDDVQHDGERCYALDAAVLGLVTFKELNLMKPWPMTGPFDAIFCRNVVIYFDEETQMRIWGKMLPLLAPGGFLYIGHSERVVGPALTSLNLVGTTTYQKTGGAGA